MQKTTRSTTLATTVALAFLALSAPALAQGDGEGDLRCDTIECDAASTHNTCGASSCGGELTSARHDTGAV